MRRKNNIQNSRNHFEHYILIYIEFPVFFVGQCALFRILVTHYLIDLMILTFSSILEHDSKNNQNIN